MPKIVFDRELGVYVQEPGTAAPINELLPMEPGFDYPGALSILPLRQKTIPYATGKGQLSLTIPGIARTMANDLWLGFTGPGRAATGEFTPQQLEEIGIRGGSALTYGGAPFSRAPNTLGAGGGWANWWSKGATPKPLQEGVKFSNPKMQELSNELKQLNSTAFSKFTKKGYSLSFSDGNYSVWGNNHSTEIAPKDLPQDLKELFTTITMKHGQFNLLKNEELSKQAAPKSALDNFNEAYSEAQKELSFNSNYKLEASPTTGQFGIYDKAGNDMTSHLTPGMPWSEAIKKLNSAKAAYAAESSGKISSKESSFAQQEWEPDPPMQPPKSGVIPPKAKPSLSSVEEAVPTPKTALKYGWHDSDEVFKTFDDDPISPVASHYPDMMAKYLIDSPHGEASLYINKDVNVVEIYTPDGGVISTKTLAEAKKAWSKWQPLKFNKPSGSPPPIKKGILGLPPKTGYGLEPFPTGSMREYTPKELDWEYDVEYGKYAKQLFPDAFKSRDDFQQQYDNSPLRPLSDKELKNLEYATLGTQLDKNLSKEQKIQAVHDAVGHRRDVPAIMKAIEEGKTAPPIVIRHDDGMRILSGNTRLMSALAHGKNMPVKVIDIRSFPLKNSDHFDAVPPLSTPERMKNFNDWFEGSKVVTEDGLPMVMYHSTDANNIVEVDMNKAAKKHGRKFLSVTSSADFANDWAGGPGQTIYPVYVSAKNPGDFRDPKKLKMAAEWHTKKNLMEKKGLKNESELKAYLKKFDPDRSTWDSWVKHYEDTGRLGSWSFWEEPDMWAEYGWDGVFMKENQSKGAPINFAVRDAGQVKSVFNKGWWNRDDPRLHYSGSAGAPLGIESVEGDPFSLEPVAGNPFEEEEKDD